MMSKFSGIERSLCCQKKHLGFQNRERTHLVLLPLKHLCNTVLYQLNLDLLLINLPQVLNFVICSILKLLHHMKLEFHLQTAMLPARPRKVSVSFIHKLNPAYFSPEDRSSGPDPDPFYLYWKM